jgi:hypothetical protein
VRPKAAKALHVALLALFVLLASLRVPVTSTAVDTFHEGEYTAPALYAEVEGLAFPLLIHGQLDYIPASVARRVCGPARTIVCTRAGNLVVLLAVTAAFVMLLVLVTGLGTTSAVLAQFPAVALVLLNRGGSNTHTLLHQSVVSTRDLAVVAALVVVWLVGRAVLTGAASTNSVTRPAAALWLLGFVPVALCFWAYDRGLVALALAPLALGYVLAVRPDKQTVLWVVSGAVAALLAHVLLGSGEAVAGHLKNLNYWFSHSIVAGKPFSGNLGKVGTVVRHSVGPVEAFFAMGALAKASRMVQVALSPFVLYAAFVGGGLFAAYHAHRREAFSQALLRGTLALCLAFYAVQTIRRPDSLHMRWPLFLCALLFAEVAASYVAQVPSRRRMWYATAASVFVAALLSRLTNTTFAAAFLSPDTRTTAVNVMRNSVQGVASNLRLSGGGFPTDRSIMPPGLVATADAVRARTTSCTWSLSNDGLLYVLAERRPCSRVMYPYYASSKIEGEILRDLQQSRAPVVVRNASVWFDKMGGRPLDARLPRLARFLSATYPGRVPIADGYVLHTKP